MKTDFRKNLSYLITIILSFIFLSYLLRNPSNWSKTLSVEKVELLWEFCEGDSWKGKNCTENNNWKLVKFPGIVPLSSQKIKNIWIRGLLPNKTRVAYKDYALYLALSYTIEVFLEEEKIFVFGQFQDDGTAPFNGFNHAQLVRLPENASGKYLYIRLYSDWTRIEMMYPPLIGNYSDLVLHEFISQLDILIISFFYFIFGFFALIIYRKEPAFKSFLYLGLVSLFSGAGGIYLVECKKYFYDAPLFYTRIFIPCLFALGPTLHLYVISFFGKGYKSSIQIIAYLYIPVMIISILFSYIFDRNIYYFLETYSAILSSIGMLNILFHLIYYIYKGNKLAIYFGFGFASMAGSLISFSLYIMGFTSYHGNTYLLGYFGFFLGMVFASGEEYFQSKKQLEEYSKNLERIILDKTIEIEKKNQILLEEEKKINILEKQNAISKERESIFADIHDNLGGKLLDLSFQMDKIQIETPINYELKVSIQTKINEVLKSLRNRLIIFEDLERIEENFIEGIQNFLVRRYSLIQRKIEFSVNSNFTALKLEKSMCTEFLHILQELVNNDLKYGSGKTIWEFHLANNMIYLQFQALTNWDKERTSSGNGHKTIQNRIKELNGKFSHQIENGKYLAKLQFALEITENSSS